MVVTCDGGEYDCGEINLLGASGRPAGHFHVEYVLAHDDHGDYFDYSKQVSVPEEHGKHAEAVENDHLYYYYSIINHSGLS